MTVLSSKRLRYVGFALIGDAVVLLVALIVLIVGRFGDTEWMYYPIVAFCIVPLGLGWIVSAIHLYHSRTDDANKSQWWSRLLFSGPIGPGWYLASLKDN
jgi:uncharacterized membrane protein YhaH (DUF805 family)